MYTSKCVQMDSHQLPKTSKFYSIGKKCDMQTNLGGWIPTSLGSPRSRPNDDSMLQLKLALEKCNWSCSRNAEASGNITIAYDIFINKYIELYNKMFVPVIVKTSGLLQENHGCL